MTSDIQKIKKEIEELIKIPGQVRGTVFETDAKYVEEHYGEKGIILLEKKTKELGCPIAYREIKINQWYSVGLRAVSLLAIKEAFTLEDKEIERIGNFAPKYSFIVRTMMKHFLSIERSFKESPKYWQKHYSIGILQPEEFNQDKKYLILRLKDFKIHPILCLYYLGYYLRIAQFSIRGEGVKIKETKCAFKGDEFDEYLITWK